MDPYSSDDEGPPLLVDARILPESSGPALSAHDPTLCRVPMTIKTGT